MEYGAAHVRWLELDKNRALERATSKGGDRLVDLYSRQG